jgi:hypothetical protein
MLTDLNKMAAAAKKFTDYLKVQGVKAQVKVSRYQKDIKAVEVESSIPVQDLFKSLGIRADVTDLSPTEEKAISGKYKAKLVKIKSSISNVVSVNDQLFIVNTFTEKGSIKTKQLAPERIGLTKKRYKNKKTFDEDVLKGIADLKIEPNVKIAMRELYNSVVKDNSKTSTIRMNDKAQKAMETVKSQDKQAIGKDFGEALSLRWYLNQINENDLIEFYFSEISNEPLVDYSVIIKQKNATIKLDISAKFEGGAAPSINSVVPYIDKVYKNPEKKYKQPLDVLKILGGLGGEKENTSAKILKSAKILRLDGYVELEKILKTNLVLDDINGHIQKIAEISKNSKIRIDLFDTTYKPFYDSIGKTASRDSLEVVFSGPSYKKYYSLVMSPLGYYLVDYMNKDPIYQEILNTLSREMKVEQVYLNFKGNTMDFQKKLFSKAAFKFSYGSNAKDSDNTGIKFSMTK